MTSGVDVPEDKVLRWAEVKELAEDENKCILVINDRVYDVTKFVDEHPGGEDVLKQQHGTDASNAFEDVGHSSDAREQMKTYEIAQIHSDDVRQSVKLPSSSVNLSGSNVGVHDDSGSSWTKWVIPLVIVVVAVVIFKLLSKPETDINRPPRAI